MTKEEFKKKITGEKPSSYKIRNSYGVRDYLKYYRNTRPDKSSYVLTPETFYKILRRVGDLLCESLSAGESLVLPEGMGEIIVSRKKVRDSFEDGKFRTSRFVDWGATLDLWYEDRESYENRTLLFREEDTKTIIRYSSKNATFVNKIFYDLHLTKYITKAIGRRSNTEFDNAVILNMKDAGDIIDLYRHDR